MVPRPSTGDSSKVIQWMPVTSLLVLGAAIVLGALIRVIQYSYNRSFWVDEINIATILLERSFGGLFQPNHTGPAPAGFLFLVKLIIQLGTDERLFRLIPLLSGIFSIFLFYKVSKHLFVSGIAIAATFLFALLPPLIYYSNELKPYSSDVAVALALYLLAFHLYENRLTTRKALLTAVAGASAVWFSFPAVFVLAGIGTILGLSAWHGNQISRFRTLSLVFLSWAASFLLYYFLTLRIDSNSASLRDAWAYAFIPFPPTRLWHLQQYYYHVIPRQLAKATGFGYIYVALGLFFIGCYALYSRARPTFFFMISPFALTLLGSGMEKYPFGGRMILFLVPSLICFVVEGLVWLFSRADRRISWISPALAVLIFYQPITRAAYLFNHPEWKEEIKPVLNYLKFALREGDLIYVYGANSPFQYYAPKYGIDDGNIIFAVGSRKNLEGYKRDLSRVRGNPRVWVISSHIRKDEETLVRACLKSAGTQKDATIHVGAKAYLYDLSSKTSRLTPPVARTAR